MSAGTWGVTAFSTPARGVRNGLPWKPYRYGGDDGADMLTPDIDAMPLELFSESSRSHHPLTVPRELQPCGTHAAYKRHLRRDGVPVTCVKCLEGERLRDPDRAPRTRGYAVHASANGYPLCGRPRAFKVAGPGEEVTCGLCLTYGGAA